jgi:CubicO group peptidase (beta-lactamase class C family)
MRPQNFALLVLLTILLGATGCSWEAPPTLTITLSPTITPAPIATQPEPAPPTAIPIAAQTETPSPTPTPTVTPPPPDIVGLWKEYTLDGDENYVQRLIGVSQNANGGLEMLVVDLSITTQVWAGLDDIYFQEGVLDCTLPRWGRSWNFLNGNMQADKTTINVLSRDGGQLMWERVEDAETLGFFQGLASSIDQDHASGYVYQPPAGGIDDWETAHLAEVGIDEQLISDLMNQILQGSYFNVHDILIVKDGKLVLEEYLRLSGRMYGPAVKQEYRDRVHILASSTKVVTSILIGLAIDAGFIDSVDVPVFDFFPEHGTTTDKQKERILLKHFLTMTAGLQWNPSSDLDRMWSGEDIVKLVLGKPVVTEPGEEFVYSNGLSTVLGVIVERASHMEVAEFADKYLFTPLGIEDYHMQQYPDGTTDTDGNLALRPRDFAKIGQLILDKGRYNGAQIISEEWVRESTEQRLAQPMQRWYGYQWWQTDFQVDGKTIAAIYSSGWGGQFVFIFPELDLVFVANGENFDEYKQDSPLRMLENYVLPAVLSSEGKE